MSDHPFQWARTGKGYEVSSRGDARFSAFTARMPDGRTIEQWYQCDIKGYDPGGTAWSRGKGKPPLIGYPGDQLYEMYLFLWRMWTLRHLDEMMELETVARKNNFLLTDMFAHGPVNQARALAQILNEWFGK